jgi:hypothetical protein
MTGIERRVFHILLLGDFLSMQEDTPTLVGARLNGDKHLLTANSWYSIQK